MSTKILSAIKKIAQNVPQERWFSKIPVGIVGAPVCKGTGKVQSGLVNGPSELRKRGLIQEITDHGIDVKDFGDVQIDHCEENQKFGKCKYPVLISTTCQKISTSVKQVLEEGRKCLTIGGDHSLGMATVYGHSLVYDQMCVLWIDAHTDINTEFTTPSGNMHGMPCSFFIKEMQKYRKQPSFLDWLKPCVNAKNIAYIGCHSIDPLEKSMLIKENILHYTMTDVDRLGAIEVVNRALDHINPSGKLSLHVSFDIDCLDQNIIASTTCPSYGGFTLREVFSIAEEINKRDIPHAIDVVEIDPSIGTQEQINRTLDTTLLITKSLLGIPRCGYESDEQIPIE